MRVGLTEHDECAAAIPKFVMTRTRGEAIHFAEARRRNGHGPVMVIPRYSALPYYEELEKDLRMFDCTLLNTHKQHRYAADFDWYHDFVDITPETWMRVEDLPRDAGGSFVLKGKTNSRKDLWRTHMFAKTRADVSTVMNRLLDDPLTVAQGIIVRRYEAFNTFGVGLNGAPVIEEWRYFILDGEIVAGGFYWAGHYEAPTGPGQPPRICGVAAYESWSEGAARLAFVRDVVAPRLKDKIRFAAVDVARTAGDDHWRLIEVNDGQMAGLSTIDPNVFYGALQKMLPRPL